MHWLLSCVFLRFIEDNALVERPWLGGTPEAGRLALARDRHEAYFRADPLHSDRDYLLAAFAEAGTLPGLHTFFDAAHNPVFRLGISGDAAMALRQFWQQVDPNTGALVHDFTDADVEHPLPRRPVPGPVRGARASATRCCRRRSSSRSSSSTAR